MRKRVLLLALGALALPGACSEDEVPFFASDDGSSTSGTTSGDAGEATGGAATGGVGTGGANTAGANTAGANTAGANAGGDVSGGANTGGSATAGATTGGVSNTGGSATGGGAGAATGGVSGGGAGSNTGGQSGVGGGAAGASASGGKSGAGGANGGRGGASGMSGGGGMRAGSGGVGGSGTAGQGGDAGGSSGPVLVRPESLRAIAGQAQTTIPRAPAIQGQDGLLLAHIVYDDTTTVSSAPDLGFELVTTATRDGSDIIVMRIYWKVASGTAGQMTTEPSSYDITNSDNRYQDVLLFAVYGYDPTMPVADARNSSGAMAAMSVPGIGVLRTGSLGVWFKAGFNATTAVNPTGFTMLAQDQDDVNDIGWRVFPVGVTGPITAMQDSPSAWANAFVVVQPP